MVLIKTTAIVIAVALLLLWGAQQLPRFAINAAPASPETEVAAVAAALPDGENGYAVLEGTVIMETSTSSPVPYLVYERGPNETRTKQLIWVGTRGCATQNGDLPCLAGADAGQYPDLAGGEQIRVRGMIEGDQILVESLEEIN